MWGFLAELVLGLLKWMGTALVTEVRKPDTMEDGQGPGALEERLRARVKTDGWP